MPSKTLFQQMFENNPKNVKTTTITVNKVYLDLNTGGGYALFERDVDKAMLTTKIKETGSPAFAVHQTPLTKELGDLFSAVVAN